MKKHTITTMFSIVLFSLLFSPAVADNGLSKLIEQKSRAENLKVRVSALVSLAESRDRDDVVAVLQNLSASAKNILERIDARIEQKKDSRDEIDSWNTYRNKEFGFEIKIPPLFEEEGCTIVEPEYDDEDNLVIGFKVAPINPSAFTSIDTEKQQTMFRFHLASLERCEEDSDICEYIREDMVGDVPTWTALVAENDEYLLYYPTGSSYGDFFCAMGWDTEDVREITAKMLRSVTFVDSFTEEELQEWMEKESDAECDYKDEFRPTAKG